MLTPNVTERTSLSAHRVPGDEALNHELSRKTPQQLTDKGDALLVAAAHHEHAENPYVVNTDLIQADKSYTAALKGEHINPATALKAAAAEVLLAINSEDQDYISAQIRRAEKHLKLFSEAASVDGVSENDILALAAVEAELAALQGQNELEEATKKLDVVVHEIGDSIPPSTLEAIKEIEDGKVSAEATVAILLAK